MGAVPEQNREAAKGDICQLVADARNVTAIRAFIESNIGCCKQHVYLFSGPGIRVPTDLPESSLLSTDGATWSVFIARKIFKIILTENLERRNIEFLWPFKVRLLQECLIVQFVTLEKDIKSHAPAGYVVEDKGIDEGTILDQIATEGITRVDIHKGIKDLWDDGFMDCPRVKYVDPLSTTDTVMKEARGIREFNPALYAIIKTLEYINAAFALAKGGEAQSVHGFSVEPSDGYVALHRYSDQKGDAEIVISKILTCNREQVDAQSE